MGLGHDRLSIIDLSGGLQPISNEDGTVWIICNGEIFNYIELREELQARGHHFRTGSDCEVIVHLYEERGPACINSLNGQWAFALWDSRRQSLLLARDRFGVRPLFYTEVEGNLLFASEIKALLADPRVEVDLDREELGPGVHLLGASSRQDRFPRDKRSTPRSLHGSNSAGNAN